MTASIEQKMSSYEARRETFFQQDAAPTKSRKKIATSVAWPHPIAGSSSNTSAASSSSTKANRSTNFPTPSEMANLGLYFVVGHAYAPDACVLYPEGDVLGNWKAGDDVEARIAEANSEAAFVTLQRSKACGKEASEKWQWTDEKLLPTAKSMTDVRLRTFSTFWPYDGKKGWKPNAKRLAQAGFHYTPNDEEEDCATCIYCNCSLGGWEKTDDPIKEHQRRRSGCPFFNCEVAKQVNVESAEEERKASDAATTTTTTKRSRAVSKRKLKEEVDDEKVDDRPVQDKEEGTSRSRKQRKTDEKEELAKEQPAPVIEVVHTPPVTSKDPVTEDVKSRETEIEQKAHDVQSRSSTQSAPSFSVAPLTSLPSPSKAEREMTVEGWLKMQVARACEEMQSEGAERIEALRKEMAKARTQVEAMLRGRPVPAAVTAVITA